MGRRSTLDEFTMAGSEANLALLAFAAGGLFLAALITLLLPWWTLALIGVGVLTTALCLRDA